MTDDYGILQQGELTTLEFAEKWNADRSSVASWCKNGFIEGAEKSKVFPFAWLIPSSANRPMDFAIIRELLWQILEFSNDRISNIDLTNWGIPANHVGGCIQALVDADYLVSSEDGARVGLTAKAFETLGRFDSACLSKRSSVVLVCAAEVAGSFAGSFAKGFLV